jgi:hypothetical protein
VHTTAPDARQFVDALQGFATVLAIKLYRLEVDGLPPVPVLPCLDHEALLHGGIDPHISVYVEDASANLHEVAFTPQARRLELEVASTIGECTKASREAFVQLLRRRFPDYAVRLQRPSRVRNEYRVMDACRAQVTLREVLTGRDLDRTKLSIDRLQTISALMEKQSRSASWGARTVMTPLIAVAGFLSYETLNVFVGSLTASTILYTRYLVITLVGGFLLYYGVKAVQLTETANRVWKRCAEYTLILNERRRLAE